MLITIFFMIASIGLIICIPIYIKKKNDEFSLMQGTKTNLRKHKKNIKNIWGIEKIKNNILTIDGKNSIIVEIGSIEYRLLNEDEQNNIDSNLIKISKTFKNQIQFFSTIERIDTNEKIEDIRQNINKQKNPKIKEYGEGIIKYLYDIMQEESLYVRKNYIILTSSEPLDKAKQILDEYYNELKYNLNAIRVTTRILSDIDIIELLHRELNKNTDEKIKDIIEKGGLDFYVEAKSKT